MEDKKKSLMWTPSSTGPATWFPVGEISKEKAINQFKKFGFRYKYRGDKNEDEFIDYETLDKELDGPRSGPV